MDYKELIENLERRGMKNGSSLGEHSGLYEQAAYAITDLLARAEEAEARRDEARKDCAVAERNHMIEVERRKSAEAREKKAERERDAAVSNLETVMAYGGGNLDTCQFCKNGQCYARGGTKLCFPEWRGQKEK